MSNCIVLISHSDYTYNLGGTEKFIGEIIKSLRDNDINSIHIFPINRSTSKLPVRKIGVNHNGVFVGVYSEDKIINVINFYVKKNNYKLNNIQIHHLYGWERVPLAKELEFLNIPINFFVHDFQLINSTSITGDVENNINVNKTINFFEIIEKQLDNIIVPSNFTRDKWLSYFPKHKNKIKVRDHLVSKGIYVKKIKNKPLRIAFVGSFVEHKGSIEWLELMKNLNSNLFKFYYFGESKVNIKNLTYREVKFQKKTDVSMQDMLRKDNIDIVFLWSKLPETYSYTFFESLASGALIITNKISGNITKMVSEYNCGLIFESVQECIKAINQKEYIYKSIDTYIDLKISPAKLIVNNNIEVLLSNNSKLVRNVYNNFIKVRRNLILTLLYTILKKRN